MSARSDLEAVLGKKPEQPSTQEYQQPVGGHAPHPHKVASSIPDGHNKLYFDAWETCYRSIKHPAPKEAALATELFYFEVDYDQKINEYTTPVKKMWYQLRKPKETKKRDHRAEIRLTFRSKDIAVKTFTDRMANYDPERADVVRASGLSGKVSAILSGRKNQIPLPLPASPGGICELGLTPQHFNDAMSYLESNIKQWSSGYGLPIDAFMLAKWMSSETAAIYMNIIENKMAGPQNSVPQAYIQIRTHTDNSDSPDYKHRAYLMISNRGPDDGSGKFLERVEDIALDMKEIDKLVNEKGINPANYLKEMGTFLNNLRYCSNETVQIDDFVRRSTDIFKSGD